MAASNGYAPGSTGGGGTASAVGTDEDTGYWTLAQCKEAFSDKNVFTQAGWRETKISKMCESCWDNLFKAD